MPKLREVLSPLLDGEYSPRSLLRVLEYVVRKGQCFVSEIVRDLNIPWQLVNKYLEHLSRHGLVELRMRKSRTRTFRTVFATNRGETLLKILDMEVDYPREVESTLREIEQLV